MKSIFAALDTQYHQSDHISICLSLDLGPIQFLVFTLILSWPIDPWLLVLRHKEVVVEIYACEMGHPFKNKHH